MRITLIGSGNVATHLGAAFKNAGHRIVQVYSRNMDNAALLAYHIDAEPINNLSNISPETDLFIIAVNDDAIVYVAQQLARHNKPIVHTAGATDINVLIPFTAEAGVFYPLQTLSKNKEAANSIPICIEGYDDAITLQLEQLASSISQNVYRVSSAQRKILHLAAVFACNFPNYLYATAQHLLAQHDMAFELLRPLILETAQKVQDALPGSVQTGPAARNDETTMAAHLQLLDNDPQLQELYRLLSQGIIKMDSSGQGRK
jgi:predicted short-subunit dehydrogenase-like oxidoreductase (DUF2520 family)